MAIPLRVALLGLAGLALAGCAAGEKLGWHKDRAEPTAAERATCETSVRTLEGSEDHALALRACLDSKTHL
jgi:hypothetical protein